VRRASPTCTPSQRATSATARWEALGTSVVLRVTEPLWLPRASAILARELDAIDRACSRFRADSDLTRVNAHAGRRPVSVAPLLVEALQVALRAAELTDGDVDPTIGAALVLAETGMRASCECLPASVETGMRASCECLPASVETGMRASCECLPASVGYDRDWSLLRERRERTGALAAAEAAAQDGRLGAPPSAETPSPPTLIARRLSGHRTVELDAALSTVRVPSGILLDLGASAKAWAADRGARAVWEAAGCGVLVSLGGDIATAGAAPAGGWRIHVTDDHRSGPDAPGQTVAIADGGLATSSVAVRRWQRGGQTMHHIIDPSLGTPARGPWRTVSVAAADCADANIAATAALVRGRHAPAWLDRLGLPARLVAHDGAVLRLCDWPLDESAPTPRPPAPLDDAAPAAERPPAACPRSASSLGMRADRRSEALSSSVNAPQPVAQLARADDPK
jgi:thiamine biosynthesis lipoprotein ApbE